MIRRGVPLLALAGLLLGVAPAAAQQPAAQTAVQTAAQTAAVGQTVAAVQTSLPVDGDPAWSKVFEDGFNLPHPVSADGKSFTVGGNPVWSNIGTKPISQCATVDTTAGTITLKPFPKVDPASPPSWQCRLTTNAQFGSGTYIFAARIKVHSSTGHLSSFWLNGPQTNEIDVIENSGVKSLADGCKTPDNMVSNHGTGDGPYYGLNHTYYSAYAPNTAGYKHCLSQGASTALQDDQFHTFHAEWTPGQSIKFSTDGNLSATFGPQYAKDLPLNAILTNIDKESAANPAQDFVVNWVKVWKKNPPPACADNECWRAQLGVYPYTYKVNSNMSDPRLARIIFDRQFYLDSYPDVLAWSQNKVATQGGNIYDHAQWHWLNYGIPWGRAGSATFDPIYYMNAQPDVSAAYGWNNYSGAISHYINYGRFEGRRASTFFDAGFYRARYGDMAGWANYAVVDHFTTNGLDEGRQGSADFAPAWYLGANPDLRNAYGSNYYRRGMSHWISNGRNEGRPGAP